ncbi:MAG TPA: DNA-processing protein DprA [candidate division Zixibacteria bacterium]|jgi:DNA processing protein
MSDDTQTLDRTILYALTVHLHLSPRMIFALVAEHGSTQDVWDAEFDDVAAALGLEEDARERWALAHNSLDLIAEEFDHITSDSVSALVIGDTAYPRRLERLGDPPPLLYVHGESPDGETPCVGVVGTHEADAEGIADAVAWGRGLAERGVTVISGLARGIDGGAHTGALAGSGKTVAVLGSGFANIYPPEHRGLAEQITTQGALVSEYPPNASITKARLIRRNRLIAALSDALVVVRIHEGTRGTMEAIDRAGDVATPVFIVASDTSEAAQRAIVSGAIPLGRIPDFNLVLGSF